MSAHNKRHRCMPGLVVAMMLASGCQAMQGAASDDDRLVASGTIQVDQVRIAGEMGGRIVQVRAKPGAQVKAGDDLVILDASPLLTRLAEAEAAVAVAQADLNVIKAEPRAAGVAAARATLALAEAQRDDACSAWENAVEVVNDPQDLDGRITEARASVELAVQNAELARAQLAREQMLRDQTPKGSDEGRYKVLVKSGSLDQIVGLLPPEIGDLLPELGDGVYTFGDLELHVHGRSFDLYRWIRGQGPIERQIADLQVVAAEQALAAAQADEQTARALLNGLWSIRNEPLGLIAQANVAEGQCREAEAGVAVAQARLDDLLAGPTPEEVSVAAAAVQVAQAQADVLRAQVAKFTLTSPIDGVVLDQSQRMGEVVAPGATILTVADLRAVTLVVYAPENEIGRVRLGQAVQVTADSFPDRSFSGQVMRISDEPEFTPRNIATQEERLNTFYAVEVRLPNPDGLLKPGMPADASF